MHVLNVTLPLSYVSKDSTPTQGILLAFSVKQVSSALRLTLASELPAPRDSTQLQAL